MHKRRGYTKYFLMATEGAIKAGIYDDYFGQRGIAVVSPDEASLQKIRQFIEAVKQHKVDGEAKREFAQFIQGHGCDAVVLGCTELPVLYKMCVASGEAQSAGGGNRPFAKCYSENEGDI